MFLFELYLVFSKEVKDSNGKAKYLYKMKMLVSTIPQKISNTFKSETHSKLSFFLDE